MAKRNKRRPQQVNQQPVQQKQSSFWMITAIVAVVLLVGVSAKTMFSDRDKGRSITPIQSSPGQPITIQPKAVIPTATTLATNSVEDQVRQVGGSGPPGGSEFQVCLRRLWRTSSGRVPMRHAQGSGGGEKLHSHQTG